MPAVLLTELDQRPAHQTTIRHEWAVGVHHVWGNLSKQTLHNDPLPFGPVLLGWHDLPGQWQDPRMDQQPNVDNGCPIVERRAVEHQKHAPLAPKWQDVGQERVPDWADVNAVIGHKAGQTPFDTGHLGQADPIQARHAMRCRTALPERTTPSTIQASAFCW